MFYITSYNMSTTRPEALGIALNTGVCTLHAPKEMAELNTSNYASAREGPQ